MSSMVKFTLFAVLLAGTSMLAAPATAPEAQEWDNARANLVARQPGAMAQAVNRSQQLTANSNYSFNDYAAFVLASPGFPDEDKLRGFAEKRLATEYANPAQLVAFFDRNPPLTNPAKAQYALALMSQRPQQAAQLAREAWRGGSMSDAAFTSLTAAYWA